MEEEKFTNYQVIGGIGSAALTNPEVQISGFEDKEVVAPEGLEVTQFRPRKTKRGVRRASRRDMDVLVLSTDEDVVKRAEEIGEKTIGDELKLSFFGLKNLAQLEEQRKHPITSTRKVHLADRYVKEEDDTITEAQKALFPFSVPLDLGTLETWYVRIGKNSSSLIPVPHIGSTALNYLTRSISGLRPKDSEKLAQIAENSFKQLPELSEWIMDGPGKSLVHFAEILHTLREPAGSRNTIRLGNGITIKPQSVEKLPTDEAFMLKNSSPRITSMVLRAARAKARAIHIGESQDAVVDFWQEHIEERVGSIVHNTWSRSKPKSR